MKFNEQQRQAFIDGCKGQTVEDVEWSAEPDGSDGYWVMTLADGSELCFRTMAELSE